MEKNTKNKIIQGLVINNLTIVIGNRCVILW